MANVSLLERTGLTQDDLERIYQEEGTIDRTAVKVGCSRPTIVKYLRHIKKDRTPWKTHGKHSVQILASPEWQDQVFAEVEQALQYKRVWMDTQQRKIPRGFLRGVYFELPVYEGPVVPIYAVLRNNTRVVLLHVIKEQADATTSSPNQATAHPQKIQPAVPLFEAPAGTLRDPSDDCTERALQPDGTTRPVFDSAQTNEYTHVDAHKD